MGDHMNFCTFCIKIVMVPPTISKIFEKKFFSQIIPDIKMDPQITNKNHFQNFLAPREVPKIRL